MNTDNLSLLLILLILVFYTNYFFKDNIKKDNIKSFNTHKKKDNIETFVPYTKKENNNYCDENYYNLVEKLNNNLDHYKNKKISDIYDDLTI